MPSIINATTTTGVAVTGDNSGALALQTNNGTTAVTINTSQNVGIGTTNPSYKLHVAGYGFFSGAGNGTILGEDNCLIVGDSATLNSANIVFYTANTARMRLNTSGNLLVGNNTASPSVSGNLGFINLASTANTETQITWAKATQVEAHAGFKTSTDTNFYVNTGGALGTFGVYLTNTGTSWTSNSDERLKENLTPIVDATNKVSQLRAVIGNYINDESKKARPFLIAQDVQAVLPEAVSVNTDELETLGVSYTDVIPLLVASIKELNEKVEAQAVRIAELEGAK